MALLEFNSHFFDLPEVGETIQIQCLVTDITDLSGFILDISFDHTKIEYLSAIAADHSYSDATIDSSVEGQLVLSSADASSLQGSIPSPLSISQPQSYILFTITFRVIENQDSQILYDTGDESLTQLVDVNGDSIDFITRDTGLFIVPSVLYFEPSSLDLPAVGETFQVDCRVRDTTDLAAFEVGIDFDMDKLEFVSATPSNAYSDPIASIVTVERDESYTFLEIANADLSMGIPEPSYIDPPLNGDVSLFVVTFRVLQFISSEIFYHTFSHGIPSFSGFYNSQGSSITLQRSLSLSLTAVTPDVSVNANITGDIGTKTGNFSLPVTFGSDVEGFTDAHISVSPMTPVSSFSVTGSGRNWRINFVMLPNIHETEITVRISTTTAVTVGGVGHTILASSVFIIYDSTSEISAIFSNPEYNLVNEFLEIKTQVDFLTIQSGHAEIIGLDKTDFHLLRLDGDDIYDFNYWITGKDLTFFLHIVPQKNRSGTIQIDITGTVLKFDGVENDIVAINSQIIPYSTYIPRLVDYEIPASITEGIWDVYIEYDQEVTGFARDNFVQEGATLTLAAIYRYTGSVNPQIHDNPVQVPAVIPSNFDLLPANVGDWIKLDSDSGVSPNQNELSHSQNTDFEEDGNTTPSRYFLLRFVNEQLHIDSISGSYNLTFPPRSVRGPDGR